MNMLCRWKIYYKYCAVVEAQFAEMVSFVFQNMATSVCTQYVICTDDAQQILGWKM
jgi:hypothetical protein